MHYQEGEYNKGAIYICEEKIEEFIKGTLTYQFVFSDGYETKTLSCEGPLLLRGEVFHGLIHEDYLELIIEASCKVDAPDQLTYKISNTGITGTLNNAHSDRLFSGFWFIQEEGEFFINFYYKGKFLEKKSLKVKEISPSFTGSIEYKDIALFFPLNSVNYQTKISIMTIATSTCNILKDNNHLKLVSEIYRLGPYNKRFNKEITISINPSSFWVSERRKLCIYKLSNDKPKYIPTYISKEGKILAKIEELGDYAVFYNPRLKSKEEVRIFSAYTYPNPMVVKRTASKLKIAVETGCEACQINCKIYDLTGEFVKQLDDFKEEGYSPLPDRPYLRYKYIAEWDLQKESIASGIYLYLIEIKKDNKKDNKIGKLTIIR
jgi:hypothetical protein